MKGLLRPGLLALTIGLILALSFVLIPGRRAQAVTGAPAVTVVLAPNNTGSGAKIDVSGVYSDPEGVCATSGKTVNIIVKANDSNGATLKTFTSGPTTSGGAYGPTTTPNGPLGPGTWWVQSTVQGSLAGGYGAGDVCPDVSNSNTIVLT
jgi:hypothetical protein